MTKPQSAAGAQDRIAEPPPLSSEAVVVIDAGNAAIDLAAWDAGRVSDVVHVATEDHDGFAACLERLAGRFPGGKPAAAVVASVVPDAVGFIRDRLASSTEVRPLVIGDELALPIPLSVDEPNKVGVDRVCAAAAAFDRTRHACVVIDFGTAVTVDLVDDDGVFSGGAILPGPALQAQALATGTAALPQVALSPPERPIGLDTTDAIRSGIFNGIAGAVRGLVEQYATVLNTWPQVVATGGDLETFLSRCDFIDSAVPNLTLMGVGLAYARHRETARE